MTSIRLLFFLTSPVRGGVEEVVLALLQRLPPEEFRLALAAPAALLDAFDVDLRGVCVDTLPVHVDSWLQRGELSRLGEFMAHWHPDVVNAHLFRSTMIAAPLARWHRIRGVVETYHGREGWRQRGLRGQFLVDRAVCRCVDAVIAVSEAARRFLIEGKGYPEKKIVVVPNGRDLSAFTPGVHREAGRKELGLDDAVPLVGVVGRLEHQKGHTYLFDAWPAVVRDFPDARLLVVGDGSLRPSLERRARALGIADNVIFTGFRADVARLLDTMDALALPSLYEGMPLTAIEASAMARPVVATAVDGTPEVVDDDVTGYLVPPADPRALGRALARVLGDRERAAAMGRAGRHRVLERFGLDGQVEATARVYRRAVTRSW
jgi:glycosyltransferase involved in cell wall biosynthesis